MTLTPMICTSTSRRHSGQITALATLFAIALAGCGSKNGGGSGSSSGGGSAANYIYLSGNWQITATPTAVAGSTATATAPFSALAGYINEEGTQPGVDDVTTAALQAQNSSCYTDATTIPMQGSTQGANLHVVSFPVVGQTLTLTAKKDATATHLTGNYSISGGCADGSTGTIAGTQYANLTGSFSGAVTVGSATHTYNLQKLSQYTQGTGSGTFLVTDNGNTSNFSGYACLATGKLNTTASYVLGNSVNLVYTTNDPTGATLALQGTMDTSADTITVTNVDISGGSCAGNSAASGSLSLQQ